MHINIYMRMLRMHVSIPFADLASCGVQKIQQVSFIFYNKKIGNCRIVTQNE